METPDHLQRAQLRAQCTELSIRSFGIPSGYLTRSLSVKGGIVLQLESSASHMSDEIVSMLVVDEEATGDTSSAAAGTIYPTVLSNPNQAPILSKLWCHS